MAQDPEADTTSGDDMVPLFTSMMIDAELEATSIHGVLQANGVPSVLVGNSVIPTVGFQVQVPRSAVEDAERVLREARAAGPAAAAEAEAAGEEAT